MSIITELYTARQMADTAFDSAVGGRFTIQQGRLLSLIGALDKPCQTDLVTATGIDRSTLADVLRRMERDGMIARATSKKDGRAKVVTLTAAGRKLVPLARDALAKTEDFLHAAVDGIDRLHVRRQPEKVAA